LDLIFGESIFDTRNGKADVTERRLEWVMRASTNYRQVDKVKLLLLTQLISKVLV